MKNFVLIIALSFCSFVNAQIGNKKDWAIIGSIICTRLELTIMNDKSFLSFGPKIPLNENNYVSLRGHFNWWDTPERKFIVIPELDYFYKIADFKEKKYNYQFIYRRRNYSICRITKIWNSFLPFYFC